MSERPFEDLRFRHGSAWQLRIEAARLTKTMQDVGEGYYEVWDKPGRKAALDELARAEQAIDQLRKQLTAPVEESLQGPCKQHMVHADGSTEHCILPALHLRFGGVDHVDQHGHQAEQLVSWSTIEEVRRVQEARDRGDIK